MKTAVLCGLCLLQFTAIIPVDAYARLSAECSIEGLERSVIKDVWCQREMWLGIFITTYFRTARHLRHSSDKIANKKFVITYAKTKSRALNLNKKNYCVPTEDVKLLRRNLRPCLKEVTGSFRLFKLARSALEMMKYFSHKHKFTAIMYISEISEFNKHKWVPTRAHTDATAVLQRIFFFFFLRRTLQSAKPGDQIIVLVTFCWN